MRVRREDLIGYIQLSTVPQLVDEALDDSDVVVLVRHFQLFIF